MNDTVRSIDRQAAPTAGLRRHINRLSYVTVNVTDAGRSKDFLEACFPVTAIARTSGVDQPFPGLGIERGTFDGYMMRTQDDLFPAHGIHLVEWQDPRPTGKPNADFWATGYYRIAAVTDDINAAHERVLAAGGRPYGPPTGLDGNPEGDLVPSFGFMDPDGITFEFYEGFPEAPPYDRLTHVNANVKSLKRSLDFYQHVVGLDWFYRSLPSKPRPASEDGSLGTGYEGLVDYDSLQLCYRADTRSFLDILQWLQPSTAGVANTRQTDLGISKFTFEVDDIEAAHGALRGDLAGTALAESVTDPEVRHLGDLGDSRYVNFSDPDGLLLELAERPTYLVESKGLMDLRPLAH